MIVLVLRYFHFHFHFHFHSSEHSPGVQTGRSNI